MRAAGSGWRRGAGGRLVRRARRGRCGVASDRFSGEQLFEGGALVEGGAFGSALVAVDEVHVIDAHGVEDGGVEVVDVEWVFGGEEPEVVG